MKEPEDMDWDELLAEVNRLRGVVGDLFDGLSNLSDLAAQAPGLRHAEAMQDARYLLEGKT